MTSSHADIAIWYTLSSITSGFLGFAMCVTFFVGAFIVRRTRPDVFGLLITSSSIQLGNLFLSHGLTIAIPIMITGHSGSGGAEEVARAMFFAHMFTSIIFVIGNVLLFAAILKLAKGPEVGNAFAEGRYT